MSYATTAIPTYPSGQIGMLLCCKACTSSINAAASSMGAAEAGSASTSADTTSLPLDPRVPRQKTLSAPTAVPAATPSSSSPEAPASSSSSPLCPSRTEASDLLQLPPLRYYDADVHVSAFALPRFAREALGQHLTFQA